MVSMVKILARRDRPRLRRAAALLSIWTGAYEGHVDQGENDEGDTNLSDDIHAGLLAMARGKSTPG